MFTSNFQAENHRGSARKRRSLLMGGVAGLATIFAMPAFAQDGAQDQGVDAEEERTLDRVVVRGVRRSLQSAQEIKQNADTFVDAVTAEDIGALSDRSIAEALARVPGVSISNFSGPNDPDRFSPEGSGVVIRGLTFTRSEVNGRDIFTTGLGRSVDFQDFPSELVSAIEVFKNNSADQIEGGISGTVNLVTRKPFDSDGAVIAGSLDLNHSDLQDIQDITPGGSLLLSNRWDTKIGEFGLLASGSFSRLVNETNGSQIAVATLTPDGSDVLFDENFGTTPFAEVFTGIEDVFGGTLPNAFPDSQFGIIGGGLRNEGRERERYGFDVSAQWRSPDERTTATFEYLRSDAFLSTEENVVQTGRDLFNRPADPDGLFAATNGRGGVAVPIDAAGEVIDQIPIFASDGFAFGPSPINDIIPAVPEGGTFFQVNEDGLFEAGVITSAGPGFRGIGLPGAFDNDADPDNGDTFLTSILVAGLLGSPQQTTNRGRVEESDVENYTFNLQHEFSDRFRAEFDAQYIRSNNVVFDQTARFEFFANTFINLNGGSTPDVLFLPSNNSVTGDTAIFPDANGDFTPEQQEAITTFATNPENFLFESILSFAEDSDTDEFALATNYEYDLKNDWISGLKFGARFSERDQIARATVFDFNFVNEPFSDDAVPFSIADLAALGEDPNSAAFGIASDQLVEAFDFTGLQRGSVPNPGTFLFAGDFFRSNGDLEGSPLQAVVDELIPEGVDNAFQTLGNRDEEGSQVTDIIPGTPFRESEVTFTTEQTISAYALAKFDRGPISGNIGLRWVRTEVTTLGNQTQASLLSVTEEDVLGVQDDEGNIISEPIVDPDTVIGTPLQCADGLAGSIVFDPGNGISPIEIEQGQESALCSLSIEDQINVVNFLDGSSQPLTTRNTSNLFLPSLNVKYDLGRGALLRFAASRTIFRPDFGAFRNNQFVSQDTDPTTNAFRIRAEGGNAFLDPITSINIDASIEWYFADAGSLTFSFFWKDLNDVIIQGESVGPPLTANGVTFDETEIIGPSNIADANIRGIEIGYRQFYDFLPGPLGNLGFEGTYTFVDQSAVPISAPVNNAPGDDGFLGDLNSQFDGAASNAFAITDLEGLSRHTVNAAAIYESDLISARLAYNYRSRFLLTQRDVGSPFPGLPVFNEDQGQLDGSIFFNVTPNVKIGVQAVNLTNRTIETTQQIDEAGNVAPRSFFINDRRFAVALRFNF